MRVEDAAREHEACFAWNADGAENLARAAAAAEIPLVTFSSDLVFDGGTDRTYVETDPVSPLCTYGRSKAEAERRVLAAGGRALVIRAAAFFGPWDRYNFAWQVLAALARGQGVHACPNTFVSPTFVPDLCHATLDLLIDGETGIRHLVNAGRISWHGFARAVAEGAGHDPARIVAVPRGEPRSTALATSHGQIMRPFESALAAWLDEMRDTPELAFSAEAAE